MKKDNLLRQTYKAKIKYNGNNLFSGDWIEGSLIIKTIGVFIYVIEEDDFRNVVREFEVEVHPQTVCQFTGLFDKNGKKIFEGDNLKDERLHGDFNGDIIEVRFIDGSFCYPDYGVLSLLSDCNEYSEIISNIHD